MKANRFRPCPLDFRAHGTRPVISRRSRVGVPENGGRFTVKKYHSVKRVTEDEWSHEHIELLPLNRAYDPIVVTSHEAPKMVVGGEWVATID